MKMLKDMFSSYISKELELDDYDHMLVMHGLDIIVCDGRDILGVLLLSLVLKDFRYAVYYVLVFGFFRSRSGGWHADDEYSCFAVYMILYIVNFFLRRCPVSRTVWMILFVISGVYMYMNAPTEHIYQPLTDRERRMNRNTVRILTVLFLFMQFWLVTVPGDLFSLNCILFVYNACSMAFLKHSKYWRRI